MTDARFHLYDLKVEVIEGDKPLVCSHQVGDAVSPLAIYRALAGTTRCCLAAGVQSLEACSFEDIALRHHLLVLRHDLFVKRLIHLFQDIHQSTDP